MFSILDFVVLQNSKLSQEKPDGISGDGRRFHWLPLSSHLRIKSP